MLTQISVSKKKGFTLIELMVVIVIIGILAAIAIPKLFGMSAKAKASEVGPAAGAWSKMHMAWSMETGQGVGTWASIGYDKPNENNFAYSETGNGGTWEAKNNFSDGDKCAASAGVWTGSFNGNPGTPPTMSAGTCGYLTPSFTQIGQI